MPNALRNTLVATFVAPLLLLPVVSHAIEPLPFYTLRYLVELRGTEAGDLVIDIQEKGKNAVVIRGETFPNMLAQLIGDGKIIELIEYQKTGNSLQLTKVSEKHGENGKLEVATIDPKSKTIRLNNGKTYSADFDDQIDAYSFPFLSLIGEPDETKGQSEQVVSTDSVKKYAYDDPINESLTTPAGTFKTVKISKHRVDGNNRKIAVWITEKAPRFPVKIQVLKGGNSHATITLIKKSNN